MKIVLIDDDNEELEIFKFAIDGLDSSVAFTGFTNFDAALTYLSNHEMPDYIFLDGFMNVITGKEGLKKLKDSDCLKNIKVIIYSGFVGDSEIEELHKLGAHAVITKPSTIKELQNALRKLFNMDTA